MNEIGGPVAAGRTARATASTTPTRATAPATAARASPPGYLKAPTEAKAAPSVAKNAQA